MGVQKGGVGKNGLLGGVRMGSIDISVDHTDGKALQ